MQSTTAVFMRWSSFKKSPDRSNAVVMVARMISFGDDAVAFVDLTEKNLYILGFAVTFKIGSTLLQ
jgi:hypothetical protein